VAGCQWPAGDLHPLRDGPSVVSLARRLERQSAYDAANLVLARELGGACWTLDGRLVRNATRLGLPVRLAAGTGSNGP
jgi:predicted nucleic acid-binding protein